VKKMMNSKKMWLAVVTIFISGVIIGLVSGLAINRQRSFLRFPLAGRFRNRITNNLTHRLELNAEQQAETEKIINAMAEQIRNYQTIQRPKIKAVIDSAMSEIEKLLTSEQREKFIAMRAKMAKHRGRRYGRQGRGQHQRNGQGPPAMIEARKYTGKATELLKSTKKCLHRTVNPNERDH
jgi:hypothetical protein